MWELAAAQVEALPSLLESSSIISPTRPLVDQANLTSLLPLLPLARAQILRGWDRYADGDTFEAAEDMLLADRLGQQLLDGSQSLLMSAVGHAIQSEALTELQELLSIAHDPLAHAIAAERLPMHAPQAGKFRAVLRLECGDNEALLMDPFQPLDALPEGVWSERVARIFYDVDATVAQHRKMCREGDVWASRLPAERGELPLPLPEGLSEVMTYNTAGVELLKILSIEGSLNMADAERKGQLQRDVLRLLTAARLHGFARAGKLPSRADALVPEYLPSVPRDPFTGAELEMTSGQIETSQGEPVWVTLPSASGRN